VHVPDAAKKSAAEKNPRKVAVFMKPDIGD
jgi:hypothetical protein